jgi:hypothetical protein
MNYLRALRFQFPNAKISTVTSSNMCLVELMTKVKKSNWNLKQKKVYEPKFLKNEKEIRNVVTVEILEFGNSGLKKTVVPYLRRKLFLKSNVMITNLGDRRCPYNHISVIFDTLLLCFFLKLILCSQISSIFDNLRRNNWHFLS